jgi:hypothetical protein
MNVQLERAKAAHAQNDATFDAAVAMLEGLLGIAKDAFAKKGLDSSITYDYTNQPKEDVELAVDMISHEYNQFNWTLTGDRQIIQAWGVS